MNLIQIWILWIIWWTGFRICFRALQKYADSLSIVPKSGSHKQCSWIIVVLTIAQQLYCKTVMKQVEYKIENKVFSFFVNCLLWNGNIFSRWVGEFLPNPLPLVVNYVALFLFFCFFVLQLLVNMWWENNVVGEKKRCCCFEKKFLQRPRWPAVYADFMKGNSQTGRG